MRVLIADDHPIYRAGLRRVFEAGGVQVVAEAGTGREAIARTRQFEPDVVLMDLKMPDIGGIEATRAIHEEFPMVKVVLLTASLDDRDALAAIRAGADGYLLKDVDAADLLALLQRLATGEPALTSAVMRRLWSELGRPTRPKRLDPGELTQREREVIDLMFAGVTSNRALAERLVITDNTVRYHLNNIFHKLHVRDKAQTVASAVRQGLIGPVVPGGADSPSGGPMGGQPEPAVCS